MALKQPSELDCLQVYDMTHWWKNVLRTGASLLSSQKLEANAFNAVHVSQSFNSLSFALRVSYKTHDEVNIDQNASSGQKT